jgi:geranylgeranyl diphosphate synthase type II
MENYLPLLEREIRALQFGSQPPTLYEPIRYIMALGGKRLRPLLTLLAYSIYKPNVEPCLHFAAAVEAFHNFTLMHDDIMDNAPLRRGKPAVHEKWNINTAILAGDVMLVKVYGMFLELEDSKLREVLALFNECAAGVCEGQQLDMEFEARSKVSEQEYTEMIRLKTALLLGFSLELGALLGGASASDRAILRDAGINLGIGFQLKDDLLDVYGDKKKFGKQVGGDIIANKKTFLLIKAIEKAKGKDKVELTRWLSARKFSKRQKVKAISAMYDRLGIQSLTETKVTEYFEKGFSGLEKIGSEVKLRPLIQFASQLAGRAH